MFTKHQKFTYKPCVCLDLYLSNKGNLIGNMKLIEKIMSTPGSPRFESTNHCIHVIQ